MTILPVPKGHVATIVTSLQILEQPAVTAPARSALRLERWAAPVDRDRYRALFREIGATWLWRGRLIMTDAELAATLDAVTTEVHVATRRDRVPVGLLELDFSAPSDVEIAYFGLVPGMTGHGHGGWLMAHAMRLGWRAGIKRMWVHTCDLDHPGALGFYQRQGFVAFERGVEIYEDPRAAGIYPTNVAPQILLL